MAVLFIVQIPVLVTCMLVSHSASCQFVLLQNVGVLKLLLDISKLLSDSRVIVMVLIVQVLSLNRYREFDLCAQH